MCNIQVIYLNYFTGCISFFIRHVKIRPNSFNKGKLRAFYDCNNSKLLIQMIVKSRDYLLLVKGSLRTQYVNRKPLPFTKIFFTFNRIDSQNMQCSFNIHYLMLVLIIMTSKVNQMLCQQWEHQEHLARGMITTDIEKAVQEDYLEYNRLFA